MPQARLLCRLQHVHLHACFICILHLVPTRTPQHLCRCMPFLRYSSTTICNQRRMQYIISVPDPPQAYLVQTTTVPIWSCGMHANRSTLYLFRTLLPVVPIVLPLDAMRRRGQVHTVLALLCCDGVQPGHHLFPAPSNASASYPGRNYPTSTVVLCTCGSSGKLSVSHRCSDSCRSVCAECGICRSGVHSPAGCLYRTPHAYLRHPQQAT